MAADVDLKIWVYSQNTKKTNFLSVFGAREHDSGGILMIWVQICLQKQLKYLLFIILRKQDCFHSNSMRYPPLMTAIFQLLLNLGFLWKTQIIPKLLIKKYGHTIAIWKKYINKICLCIMVKPIKYINKGKLGK